MKRLGILLALFMSLSAAFAGNDKVTKDIRVLPMGSRNFLSAHFANVPVAHIKIDKEMMRVDNYDVTLKDGTEIEFSNRGTWKEIERKRKAVPARIIPIPIRKYVKRNYPTAKIVAISKDRRNYEVELDNKTEIKFDLKGNFIKIDY